MAGSGVMSIPHTDFEVGLTRDLTAFGAGEADAEAYVQGVRHGGVMVFATGSGEQADAAAGIMNRHHAVEIEELIGSEPNLPRTDVEKVALVPIGLSKPEDTARAAAVLAYSSGRPSPEKPDVQGFASRLHRARQTRHA